ncbi:MAG: hypothetical protein QG573_679 [Acidobacteriota bacterium]|nr:hypothetical protein [Acidobacteriota bacterium]
MLRRVSLRSSHGPGVRAARSGPRWTELLGIGLFFTLLSALYLGMTPGRFFSELAPDLGDPLFNLSVLRWGASRVPSAFSDFWNPTYFFPARGMLALSDHLAGPAVLYWLLDGIGLPPAGAYNTLLLIAFAGSGATFYWVLRRSELGVLGALGGALAWTFCGFRWSALSHLQVLLALGVPLTLWLFHRLLLEPTWPSSGRFLVAYALQLSAGSYLAMMIHIPLLAIFCVHAGELASGSRRPIRRAPLIVGGAASLGMLWTVFAPYLRAGASHALETPTFKLVPYMVTLKSYLSVGARTFYSEWFPIQLKGHAQLWPGFVAVAICAVGATLYGRRRLRPGSDLPKGELWVFGLLVACCLFALVAADVRVWGGDLRSPTELQLGIQAFRAAMAILVLTWTYWLGRRSRWLERASSPTELWWKAMLASSLLSVVASHAAAFVLLRELLPGFDAIRAPARFFAFSSVGVAAFVGLGIDGIGSFIARRKLAAWAQGLLLVLLACEYIPSARYIEWQEIPSQERLAPEYGWLARQPDVVAVLELPFLENWREAQRMYYWSFHLRPIVNGYSGYVPASYELMRKETEPFPELEAISKLEKMGVSHLIIHLDQYSTVERRDWRHWHKRLALRPDAPVRLVHEEGWAMIYRILTQTEKL